MFKLEYSSKCNKMGEWTRQLVFLNGKWWHDSYAILADCPMQRDDPPSPTKCQKKLCKLVRRLKAVWKIYENMY